MFRRQRDRVAKAQAVGFEQTALGGVELVTADQLTEQEAEQLAQRNVPRKRPDVAAVAAERTAPAASPAPAQRAPAAPSALFADSEDQAEYLWTDAATMAQMREELRSLKGLSL